MVKKTRMMSFAAEPLLYARLHSEAKRRKKSISQFVRDWCEQYPFDKENVVPAVIDLPKPILEDRTQLTAFLQKKTGALVDHLCGPNTGVPVPKT